MPKTHSHRWSLTLHALRRAVHFADGWQIFVIITILFCLSCGGEFHARNECPDPCTCPLGQCPSGICGLRLEVALECEQQFTEAEVVVGNCHESGRAVPGESFVACAAIAEGQYESVTVRSAEWQWGPMVVTCQQGGTMNTLQLKCEPQDLAVDLKGAR